MDLMEIDSIIRKILERQNVCCLENSSTMLLYFEMAIVTISFPHLLDVVQSLFDISHLSP